ncbi:MAG: ubiquinol-cytochrome c reductase iron-sulfur subunit [Terriglobia bacterium]
MNEETNHSEAANPGAPPHIVPGESGQPPRAPVDRRRFIGWLLGIGGAIVAALMAIPLVRLSLYPALAPSSAGVQWSDLGPMDEYTALTAPVQKVVKIQTLDGWEQTISQKVVYVTKNPDGKVRVLTAVCPHLGCQVAWIAQADHFHCPCHGGTFARDGKYISGPPPRSMDALPTRVQGGRLKVQYEYFRNLVPNEEVIS